MLSPVRNGPKEMKGSVEEARQNWCMILIRRAVHAQDWDNQVIAMLDRCPSDKCFISHYPPAHNDTYSVQVPVLCKSHFDEGAQMPSFEAMSFDFQVHYTANFAMQTCAENVSDPNKDCMLSLGLLLQCGLLAR
jgi:hypothetical protein